MARISSYLIGGLAMAGVMIAALPAAQGIGASTKQRSIIEVNRGAKGDRLPVEPRTIAVKKAPAESARELQGPEQLGKRQIMDGCEPMFSPVTVPSMAHLAGRCIG
jgi:hypothetical protein